MKPNFLIVGAAKAGTTSMAKYLNQHPDIFIPYKKELRFFVSDAIKNISKKDPLRRQLINKSVLKETKYFNLFKNRNEKKCGEASVHYLWHYEEAIPKIKKHLGDIPIIIILRNPVERAISNWHYNGKDISQFRESFLNEEKRLNYDCFWNYLSLGLYYNQVKAYCQKFSNVRIILFDDFILNTPKVMNDIAKFLCVKDHTFKTDIIYNKHTKSIPNTKLLRFLHQNEWAYKQVLRLKTLKIIPSKCFIDKNTLISLEEDKKFISSYYYEDLARLEKIINRDLSFWKE